ncbi:unnamed protein product [Fraxinus pennsylvanica]|uniref:ELMO domain-containing protein n=1 Tax=Fraxinus pennsylvanica TaxID=56036 RepID=A0AAD2A4K7_9LAMI|nr:unnamed protein product [Fraxinus pennsylvanica]
MTSRTLRRRLHHGDVDGRRNENLETSRFDSLDEPLLGNRDYDDLHSEGHSLGEILDDGRRKENLHWTMLFSHVIAQWAQWLANIVLGSGSVIGRLLPFVSGTQNGPNGKISPPSLNPLQQRSRSIGSYRILVLGVCPYPYPCYGGRGWTWHATPIANDSPLGEGQTNIVLGSGSVIGRLLPFVSGTQNGPNGKISPPSLNPLQEARLKYLKQRLAVPFDSSSSEHQDALKQLWRLAYPGRELPALKSELWKEMGWQGSDPSTDFRGGGFVSLENLIFFAMTYPEAFQNLLHKRVGDRSEWEYPFAVAGINISFMLVQMLDLQSGKPNTIAGVRFLELLGEDEMAFDNLFCIAFEMLDAQWLAKHASYMQFNEVLKSTRVQLERELALDDVYNSPASSGSVGSVDDSSPKSVCSFNLLDVTSDSKQSVKTSHTKLSSLPSASELSVSEDSDELDLLSSPLSSSQGLPRQKWWKSVYSFNFLDVTSDSKQSVRTSHTKLSSLPSASELSVSENSDELDLLSSPLSSSQGLPRQKWWKSSPLPSSQGLPRRKWWKSVYSFNFLDVTSDSKQSAKTSHTKLSSLPSASERSVSEDFDGLDLLSSPSSSSQGSPRQKWWKCGF